MTLIILVGFVSIIIFLNVFKLSHKLTVLDIIGLVHGAICQQGTII